MVSFCFFVYGKFLRNLGYILKLMKEKCLFAGSFYEDRLVSIAAAYPNKYTLRSEMTDCATLADFRGSSLTENLLTLLEKNIQKPEKYTLFSLARAGSFGMNRIFFKLGYKYKGRLVNNCHIAGRFEDMNLWVKE